MLPATATSNPGTLRLDQAQRHVAFLVDHEVALPGSVPEARDGFDRTVAKMLGIAAPQCHRLATTASHHHEQLRYWRTHRGTKQR